MDDGRGGDPRPSNNCTKCCAGGGAPFEVTFDKDPSSARLARRNVTWVRLPLKHILIGQDGSEAREDEDEDDGGTVTLKLGLLGGAQKESAPTGVRYAWSDFVDCVLDNGNSSGIPAGPFRRFF